MDKNSPQPTYFNQEQQNLPFTAEELEKAEGMEEQTFQPEQQFYPKEQQLYPEDQPFFPYPEEQPIFPQPAPRASARTPDSIREQPAASHQKEKRQPIRRYGVGVFTAALTLITVGIGLVVSMACGYSALSVVRILPLGLVYLGLEIVLNVLARRSIKILIQPHSLMLTFGIAFVILCLSIPAMTNQSEEKLEEIDTRNVTEEELSSKLTYVMEQALLESDRVNIVKEVLAEVNVTGADPSAYTGLEDLKGWDRVNVTVTLRKTPATTAEFARDCRDLIPSIKQTGIEVDKLTFTCDELFDRMTLTLDGAFELDLTLDEMERMVGFAGANLSPEPEDIQDLN